MKKKKKKGKEGKMEKVNTLFYTIRLLPFFYCVGGVKNI